MTNQFHVLNHPMFLYQGFSATGSTKDLTPGVMGAFDAKTGMAVTAATMNPRRPIRLAMGSYHQKDNLGTFYTRLKNSMKSVEFLPQDVMHIEFSPFRYRQHEQWVMGYDGFDTSTPLKWECGKTYKFRVRVFGQGVYDFYQKQVLRDVSVTTACCDSDECGDGCEDNTLHCRKYTQMLVDAINNDVEIGRFVKAEPVYSTPNTFTASQYKTMTLSVTDNGDLEALVAVQSKYPGLHIERTDRISGVSVYKVSCIPFGDSVADYTPSTPVLLAACNTCPAGYTLTNAKDVYTVIRSKADFSNVADVQSDYAAASVATIPTADVNTTTETITETAHKFVTGQAVVYSNGGGTTLAGLTNAATYYVIKTGVNTFQLATTVANAFAGTAINLTGAGNNDQTFTPVFVATVQSQNDTHVFLSLVVDAGAYVVAVDAGDAMDTVIKASSTEATCVPSSASPIAWVLDETLEGTTRTLTAIISKECNGASRLAEVQAYYAGVESVVSVAISTVGECEDEYTITQRSHCIAAPGCLSEGEVTYEELPTFEGIKFEPVVSTEEPDSSFKCGVRFTVSSSYTQFGECSWTPEDFYTYKPTFMEVWAVEENGESCKTQPSTRKIQNAQQENQNGEWVRREYINSTKYQYWAAFDSDPRFREILEQTVPSMIGLNTYYNVYYIKIKQHRGSERIGAITQDAEIFEFPVVVKAGENTAAFENWLNSLFSQYGVTIQPREGQANY